MASRAPLLVSASAPRRWESELSGDASQAGEAGVEGVGW